MTKARYALGTIVTSDEKLIELHNIVRSKGFKINDIYEAGLEHYKRIIDSNKITTVDKKK